MTKAHLLPQQLLKREGLKDERWDPAVWVWACMDHHYAFDFARTLRLPRKAIPARTEKFAQLHGLEWFLERTYLTIP